MTPTNLLNFMPTKCSFYVCLKVPHFKSMEYASCPQNNIKLPITNDEDIKTISDLREWLKNYISTCPNDYFEKVHRMKIMPHRTIKYNVGDIYRFEIDRENYGFGLIIGKLQEFRKQCILCEHHPMLNLMTVPIFTRLYKVTTKDKNLPISEITKHQLLAAEIMSDNEIIWGTHEVMLISR